MNMERLSAPSRRPRALRAYRAACKLSVLLALLVQKWLIKGLVDGVTKG